MQRGAGRGAQSLRRVRIGSAADAGGGCCRAGRPEGRSRAQNRSHISGILDTGKDDEQGSASRNWSANEIIESRFARLHERRDPLRMFGVSEAFEEAVGGAQHRKSHLRAVDEGGEPLVMAFARFAEEYCLNVATGTQRFFDEPNALDANEAAFRRQAAAQSHAELLEPAIVAAGEECGFTSRASVTSSLARRCHYRGA